VTGWLDLPWLDLRPSVRVDILGVLASGKPAIRIPLRDYPVTVEVMNVITAVGWSAARDHEYLVAAPTSELARHILDVDRRPQPHALELGRLLGYPECCTRAAATAGEENIDAHAAQLGTACDRVGAPDLDPRGYAEGIALVPYVACSPRCPQAMRHAHAARRHITGTTRTAETREPWATWLHTHELLQRRRTAIAVWEPEIRW